MNTNEDIIQSNFLDNSKRVVQPNVKPPVGGMGGSVHDWERGLDPWHRDAFPDKFKDSAPNQGVRSNGWSALDWCGNVIGFLPDGAPLPDTNQRGN